MISRIGYLSVGQVVNLIAGGGTPSSDKNRHLHVVSCSGNSALFSDGTRVSSCNGDEEFIQILDEYDELFVIAALALDLMNYVGEPYHNQDQPILEIALDEYKQTLHLPDGSEVDIYFHLETDGSPTVFVRGLVKTLAMQVGDSLIYNGDIYMKYVYVADRPTQHARVQIYGGVLVREE